MKKADPFRDSVLDPLRDVDGVARRAMFGGHGLYRHGAFFGILYKGRLYFKTDAASRPDYTRCRMRPFRPKPGMTLKTHDEVPGDVLEDRKTLAARARRAADVGDRA